MLNSKISELAVDTDPVLYVGRIEVSKVYGFCTSGMRSPLAMRVTFLNA
jgi:hypothetical protein